MNLKLANWIIGAMKSDSEIFEFLKEKKYDFNLCTVGIPEIKDLDVLDELIEHVYYRSQYAFRIAFETMLWRKNLLNYRASEKEVLFQDSIEPVKMLA